MSNLTEYMHLGFLSGEPSRRLLPVAIRSLVDYDLITTSKKDARLDSNS